MRGTPWNPLGTPARESLTAGGEALQKPASRRRLYLKDWMFKELGKTKGCPGCAGKEDRHSELCRARITPLVEEKMRKKEEADKQAAADARFAVGRAPEPGIPEGGPSSSSGIRGLMRRTLRWRKKVMRNVERSAAREKMRRQRSGRGCTGSMMMLRMEQ